MEPVAVDITRASVSALRAECRRLGIDVGQRTRVTTLRASLRSHSQKYAMQQRWIVLATLLFGKEHGLDLTSFDTLLDGIYNRLYDRLVAEGLVGTRLLTDEGNHQRFIVTGRQNNRNATTEILRETGSRAAAPKGSHNILFVACLAFPDVKTAHDTWEAQKTRLRGK